VLSPENAAVEADFKRLGIMSKVERGKTGILRARIAGPEGTLDYHGSLLHAGILVAVEASELGAEAKPPEK
jgi:hypothetical protein